MKRFGETAGASVQPGRRLPPLRPLRLLMGKPFAVLAPPERHPSDKREGGVYLIMDIWHAGETARYSCDSGPVAAQLAAIPAADYPVWGTLRTRQTPAGSAYELDDTPEPMPVIFDAFDAAPVADVVQSPSDDVDNKTHGPYIRDANALWAWCADNGVTGGQLRTLIQSGVTNWREIGRRVGAPVAEPTG